MSSAISEWCGRQTGASHELIEPWIGPQRVENEIEMDRRNPRRALLVHSERVTGGLGYVARR
jgi:hypothetical protein